MAIFARLNKLKELPKTCWDCPLQVIEYQCVAVPGEEIAFEQVFVDKVRPPFCPLTEFMSYDEFVAALRK